MSLAVKGVKAFVFGAEYTQGGLKEAVRGAGLFLCHWYLIVVRGGVE
jgi:hypothetical protein